MENSTSMHMLAAKIILRYLQGFRNLTLFYKKSIHIYILVYISSNYAWCKNDTRNTTRFCFNMSDAVISLSSNKQYSLAEKNLDSL